MENQPVTWEGLLIILLAGFAAWGVWDFVSYCVKYWRHPPR